MLGVQSKQIQDLHRARANCGNQNARCIVAVMYSLCLEARAVLMFVKDERDRRPLRRIQDNEGFTAWHFKGIAASARFSGVVPSAVYVLALVSNERVPSFGQLGVTIARLRSLDAKQSARDLCF